MSIIAWKKYLQGKHLYNGEIDNIINASFIRGMKLLEKSISDHVPSVKGMIWDGTNININATIADVDYALKLIDKFGVANFDALGPPGEDKIGTPFKQMFISQEDSKIDEWDPKKNQNQGTWQNQIPKDLMPSDEAKPQEKSQNIDDMMSRLVKLIEKIKK